MLTIAAKIKNVVECGDHLIPDIWIQCSNISSHLVAYEWNVVGIMVNFMAQCVLDLKFLLGAFSAS